MNRRDFLLLRTEGKKQVLELSCERFYMRFVDARSEAGRGDRRREEQRDGQLMQGDGCANGQGHGQWNVVDSQWWSGEPPTVIDKPTTRQFFQELERTLSTADAVRLRDPEWLVGDLRRPIEALLDAFREQGGCVEYADGQAAWVRR